MGDEAIYDKDGTGRVDGRRIYLDRLEDRNTPFGREKNSFDKVIFVEKKVLYDGSAMGEDDKDLKHIRLRGFVHKNGYGIGYEDNGSLLVHGQRIHTDSDYDSVAKYNNPLLTGWGDGYHSDSS